MAEGSGSLLEMLRRGAQDEVLMGADLLNDGEDLVTDLGKLAA